MSNRHRQRLRERAELLLAQRAKALPPFTDTSRAPSHELLVFQTEVEILDEELHAARHELDTSRQRYGDLFDFSPVGFVIQDPRGILRANRSFADLVAAEPAMLARLPLARFVAPAHRDALRSHERAVFESGARESVELGLVTRLDEAREVRLESVCTNATERQWQTAVVDVTEERRLERHVLGYSTRDGRGVTHDFRNVLMSVVAQADRALARLVQDHASRNAIENVKRIATDGATQVTRLLDELRPAPVTSSDIDHEIRNAEPLLRRLGGPTIAIHFAFDAKGGQVQLSPAELVQILTNLVSNAADAMPRGGDINIDTWCTSTAEAVVLRVSDTGRGMDVDGRLHAFDPFFTARRNRDGTGLGLPTVYVLVKRAGGRIHLRSTPDVGTSFRIVLPRVVPAAAPVAASKAERKLTVLLVTADEAVRRSARQALDGSGYDVLEATSAQQGLERLRSTPHVRLLLCDVVLADMSCGKLVGAARALMPNVCTVLVGDPPGQDDQIPEPVRCVPRMFEPAALLEQVHAALVIRNGELPTVLVVEDDTHTLRAYQELLWYEGFRMLAARTAGEATEVFRRNAGRIAALLSDFELPDIRGTALAAKLRATRPDLPVVFVSGQQADPELDAACDAPRSDRVAKPVEISKLATVLRRLISESGA